MNAKTLATFRRNNLTFNRDVAAAKIRRLRKEAQERLEATRRIEHPSVSDALAVCNLLLEIGVHQDQMFRDVVELSALPK
jgi:hypothetical protein